MVVLTRKGDQIDALCAMVGFVLVVVAEAIRDRGDGLHMR